jgi:hypothetical protein
MAIAEKTVDLPLAALEGGRLEVRMDRGTLRIRSGEPGAARLEIRLKSEADTREEAQALLDGFSPDVSEHGGEVRIGLEFGPTNETWTWFLRRRRDKHLDAEVTVTVPRRQDLRVALEAGDLEVEGAEGAVELSVKAGRLHLGSVTGDARAHAAAGQIDVGHVTGRLTIQTQIGAVLVREAGEALEISTESGDITTRLLHPLREDSRLTTKLGQIRVELADQVGADLDAQVQAGRVVCDYPLLGSGGGQPAGGSRQGAVNGGGRKLTLSTQAGQIHVGRLSPA